MTVLCQTPDLPNRAGTTKSTTGNIAGNVGDTLNTVASSRCAIQPRWYRPPASCRPSRFNSVASPDQPYSAMTLNIVYTRVQFTPAATLYCRAAKTVQQLVTLAHTTAFTDVLPAP